ncbi:MAG: hypothetical protein OXB89_09670 [Anaerolineaceae bacterium]|nr:hypothetical protein [Anaerolineaceae bacterium]
MKGLRNFTLLLLLCYLAVALAAAWWATGARQGLIGRDDNPRQVIRATAGTPAQDGS